jgi:hypothetical protein
MMMTTPPAPPPTDPKPPKGPLPEVRQCQDVESSQYGSVAVKSGLQQFTWGVFNPVNGGHWETDDETVGKWTVMEPATAPTPPPA